MNGGRAGTAGHTVWEWVRGIVSSDDTLLVATSAGPAYVMTVLSVFSWQWLTLSTASCPTPRLEKVELFLRRPIKDNLTSLVVALPVQRTCGDCKQNMIATPPRSVDSELWLKGPLQIGNRAAMGPDGIVNLFLQYVFRPLDHLLHSKDRYSPRFAFLAPVATPFNICRKALNTHGLYPWPACPAWSFMGYCSKCPGASAYWCVECDTRLCAGCAARLHHPGLYSEHHSVEPLEKRKTQVLGLLMSNLLVISFAVYMISSISIGPDYLSSADMCPVITKARSVAASVDSKVFYYYKADLTRYCNMEDSFYKFFLDGWVRGIVTSSDDTLLAATSAGPAYVMTTVLSVFLVPVAASIYAALMAVAHFVDGFVPHSEALEKVELFLRRYDLCSFFGGLSAAPPPTGWRKRKDLDVYDQLMYMRNRRSRFFNYFFSVARDDMTYWVNRSVPWFLAFRLMLIWCPLDLAMIFRSLLSPFLGSTIAAQQQWFGASVSSMVLGDATVGALGLGSGAFVYTVLGLLPFSDALDTLLFYGILGFLISVAGLLGFLFVITSQQRKYYKDFEPSEVVGPCPDHDKCPCLSVAFFQKD